MSYESTVNTRRHYFYLYSWNLRGKILSKIFSREIFSNIFGPHEVHFGAPRSIWNTSVAEKCPGPCRNFCTPQKLFWCKLRYRTLMGRTPPFFTIFWYLHSFFSEISHKFLAKFWVARPTQNSKKHQKSVKGNFFVYFLGNAHMGCYRT